MQRVPLFAVRSAICALAVLSASCGSVSAVVDMPTTMDSAMPDSAVPDLAIIDTSVPDLALPDLAMTTPDLAMTDLASVDTAVPPDVATPDLAKPDLATPDLAAGPAIQDLATLVVNDLVSATTTSIAYLSDQRPNGTGAGDSTAGMIQTRALNRIEGDDTFVTLSNNAFTLAAGTYTIDASAPAYSTNRHQIRMQNLTDGTTAIVGTSQQCYGDAATRSFLSGLVTIQSPKSFEIEHYTQNTTTSGLGQSASSSFGERFTIVRIQRHTSSPSVAWIRDLKASGISGGATTGGTTVQRDLNTLAGDSTFVSLASNQFMLAPGTYEIEASAPAYQVNRHQIRLHNVTDGSYPIIGTSQQSFGDFATRSFLQGQISISTAMTFSIEHYTQTSQAQGFGQSVSSSFGELYTTVKVTKLSGESIAYIRDSKPAGTAGGASLAGAIQVRDLNTTDDTAKLVSLSGNVFSLQPGTYEISASAPSYYTNRHQLRVRSMDSSIVLVGTTQQNAGDTATRSFVVGRVMLTSPTSFLLDQFTQLAQPQGMGQNVNAFGEVFSQVRVEKLQ